MTSGKSNRPVVARIVNEKQPATILDAPSGDGWLLRELDYRPAMTGLDLFEEKPEGYAGFEKCDLDYGLPENLGKYEAFITCEGIEHVGNPLLLIEHAARHLVEGGLIVVTTPNVWFPASKLQYLWRGFFPSFPCLVGKIQRGTHMHITPWSFPHLYMYLKLAGFTEITLHEVEETKPKHFYERILALPQSGYCGRKLKQARDEEEQSFWRQAGSKQSLYGRRLVVSATYEGKKAA